MNGLCREVVENPPEATTSQSLTYIKLRNGSVLIKVTTNFSNFIRVGE